MAVVSTTPSGILPEAKVSADRAIPPARNHPDVDSVGAVKDQLSLAHARLPAISIHSLPVYQTRMSPRFGNALVSGLKRIISHEIDYALNLGSSICNRMLYGFLKSIRSLERAKPNIYSAIYAGYGFASMYLMGTLPKTVAGIVFKDPVYISNSFNHNITMMSLNAAAFFAVPFCLNLASSIKFLDSEKFAVRIKGFDLKPADLARAVSIAGVGFSSLSVLMFAAGRDLFRVAKVKNRLWAKDATLASEQEVKPAPVLTRSLNSAF